MTDFITLGTNIHLGLIRDSIKARLAEAASRHVLSRQRLFPVVTTIKVAIANNSPGIIKWSWTRENNSCSDITLFITGFVSNPW